jgi:DNA-binding transcriptional LysR family regulator
MTYDQLEVLETVVEKGSFSAAAQALHKTQPTLTVSIQKLEAEFDLLIFDRGGYRPQLTEEGRIFYKWAKDCLAAFRRLELVGRDLGTKAAEPRLTIVLDPLANPRFMDPLLQTFAQGSSSTELDIRSEILTRGEDLVRSGEADFAIGLRSDSSDAIDSLYLERVSMLPVVAATARTRKATIDKAFLQDFPHIIVRSGSTDGDRVSRWLEGGRQIYVSDHALKRCLILQGVGWGQLAKGEIAAELKRKDLLQISADLAPPFAFDLHVMKSRNKAMGPVAKAMWKAMAALS